MSMSSNIEILDSEIIAIEKVLKKLQDKQGKGGVNQEAFRKEIIERFAEAGFKVDVKWYTTNVEGVFMPEVSIVDRLEGQFDPDRMVHEVTNDLLGLGEGGVIKTTNSGLIVPKGHGHSHGAPHKH